MSPGRFAEVTCVGGAVLDRHLRLLAAPVPATSNPARADVSPGGVARNVAENLARLGVRARLCSRIGDDDAGRELLARLAEAGVETTAVAVMAGEQTAQYLAVLDPDGDLVIGVAAMQILDRIVPPDLATAWPTPPGWVFLDCNLPPTVLAQALLRARADGTPVAVDAVSTLKVVRLAAAGRGTLAGVAVLFCNLDEARALLAALNVPQAVDAPEGTDRMGLARALVRAGAGAVVLTLGAAGCLIADAAGARPIPAVPARVVDVTGAGDALVAATLSRLVAGAALEEAVRVGTLAASLTVASAASVREDLATALHPDHPASSRRPGRE